jgi:hypothetical protein
MCLMCLFLSGGMQRRTPNVDGVFLKCTGISAVLMITQHSLPTNDDDCRHAPEPKQSHCPHVLPYLLELDEGFNLLFYSLSSKYPVLNELTHAYASHSAHSHMCTCPHPQHLPRLLLHMPYPHHACATARRTTTGQRQLILIVHNIDTPAPSIPSLSANHSRTCTHPRPQRLPCVTFLLDVCPTWTRGVA